VEEIDAEKCNLRKLRKSVTLTLTLDQVKVILACTIHTEIREYHSMPNYVTVASNSTEIWPFKIREILTSGEV